MSTWPDLPEGVELSSAPDGGEMLTVDGRSFPLTSLDRRLHPGAAGWTKRQLLQYYAHAASRMLPHLHARPLTAVRFPKGVEGRPLYLKTAPPAVPDWIPRLPVPGGRQHLAVGCRADLLFLANFGVVEFHVPLAVASAPELPTDLVLDLDPGPGRTLGDCRLLAAFLVELLLGEGFRPQAKTSGRKGLHLLVPNGSGFRWEEAQQWVRALVDSPEIPVPVVLERSRARRAGRVLVDVLQNAPHATIPAPFSLRGGTPLSASLPQPLESLVDPSRPLLSDPAAASLAPEFHALRHA